MEKNQPCEDESHTMHGLDVAGCPTKTSLHYDVAIEDVNPPCMVMQHAQDFKPTPQAIRPSSNVTHKNGPVVGPSFNNTHHDGPKPTTHFGLTTQPIPHSHFEHQSSTPQSSQQEMEMLEQLWSGLSLKHTLKGTVSYVRIPVHPRTAMQWNQMTQVPSLPLRLDPPPHSHSTRSHRTHGRVHRTSHPYHTPTRHSRAPSVRQRSISTSSSNAASPDPLLAAIFRFLD